MFRHSLFAQHFMPTLVLLSPLARLFDGPSWLFVLQALFHAAAGFLLYRFARRHASNGVALALTAAFLFSRRAHGAATSVFYIESAEPLLIFGALLARESRRLVLYWLLVVLALGCKEDVALYFAVFGIVIAVVERDRRAGFATTVLSVVWLAMALGVAIPFWRGSTGWIRRIRLSRADMAGWRMRRAGSHRSKPSAESSPFSARPDSPVCSPPRGPQSLYRACWSTWRRRPIHYRRRFSAIISGRFCPGSLRPP